MTAPDKKPGDGASDAISTVLRTGVTASLLLIAVGTLLSFVQAGGYGAGPSEVARLISPAGSFPRTGSWFIGGLVHLNGQAVIVGGLLLLVATPVLRVAVSMIAFARERDRVFCAITAIVLFLLLLSFVLGKAG
jgi:uncharacterized membrane protein